MDKISYSLFYTAKNYTQLQEISNKGLQTVHSWLCTNRLSLNMDKTHFLIFNKKQTTTNIQLRLGNYNINQENCTKYLGIIIQDNLKWNKQINNIINKLNRLIPLFYILRNTLSIEKKKMVFKALALSQINYAIELYGRKNSTWIKQLQITQNRLLKILFHKNHMINTTLLHQELDMLKVLEHTQLRLILYIYDNRTKYINQRLYTLRNQLNIEVNHYTFNFIMYFVLLSYIYIILV